MPIVVNKDRLLEYKKNEARAARNKLLETKVDAINAVRWNAMSELEQQQWTDYRKALCDVTKQKGFPENIVWPVAPF